MWLAVLGVAALGLVAALIDGRARSGRKARKPRTTGRRGPRGGKRP
ncbi:hypothetical protein SAMN05216251_12265 [Actinacidiphila alni]|uniref:Uncharacterized protein n=1 Tax=Actinacidiphila alni TaxID=380248 RepID=A0A1I2KFU8_9ACTN|nr:hypothetical protein SAMN05216251_12265 [Actinacidiphila alni]